MSHIVVLGGGVAGLSVAISLLDRSDCKDTVTIVAADLPDSGELAAAHYASAWAGAHHVSDARNKCDQLWDRTTFEVMAAMQKKPRWSKGFVWADQKEYWHSSPDDIQDPTDMVKWYPDFKVLPSHTFPKDIAYGASFSTLNIVVPTYLPALYDHFISLGGRTVKAKAASVEGALSLATADGVPTPEVIVLSPGLGARTLKGLEDPNVHPVRGQTLLVLAPWLKKKDKNGHAWEGISLVRKEGWRDTYVIPRGDGTFIVGGTRVVNDSDPKPREDTTRYILSRVLGAYPNIADPTKRPSSFMDPLISDVNVVGVNVGLRPARTGGPIVERAGEAKNGEKVVLCYGFGGIGYQASWGAAFEARDCVDDALARSRAPAETTLASLDSAKRASRL